MCSEDQLAGMNRAPAGAAGMIVNRRQFGTMGALAGFGALAACSTVEGATSAGGLVENNVTFAAPGGTMDAVFVHPGEGRHPAVILWPDIAGVRDSFMMMARRLAAENYAVLLVNPYYRDVPAPQFADFEDFRNSEGFQKVGPWRAKMNAQGVMETTRAVVEWLDRQAPVDTSAGIGNQGYCMSGPYTIWAAAAVPERVKAGASFHGGGLVQEGEPTSPHDLFDETQAQFLIAIARNDDAQAPTHKDVLREAAMTAGRPAEIEVYQGDHGWTVPDSPVYAEAEAERAWTRLLALYETAL
jgi:carboxymethylenebutenolidase